MAITSRLTILLAAGCRWDHRGRRPTMVNHHPLGSTALTSPNIYDTLILDNSAVYLSVRSANRLIRVDPQIQY